MTTLLDFLFFCVTFGYIIFFIPIQDIFRPTKIELDREEIDVLARRFDLNNNGYITMKDFLRFARSSKGKSHLATELRKVIRHSELNRGLSLKAAFRAFDTDGTGRVTREQFEDMLRNLGFHPTQVEVRKLFQSIDKDDGGTVELAEFERWVRKESRDEETSEETALWRTAGGRGDDEDKRGAASGAPSVPVELEDVQRKISDAIENMSRESSTFDIEAVFEQVSKLILDDNYLHATTLTIDFYICYFWLKIIKPQWIFIEYDKSFRTDRCFRITFQFLVRETFPILFPIYILFTNTSSKSSTFG